MLREEEACETDNSEPLYTMSTILHIQILLHTVQPEPRTFPRRATRTFPRRATRTFPRRVARTPKPKTSSHRAIKPKEPKPIPGAAQSRTFQTLVVRDWWFRRRAVTVRVGTLSPTSMCFYLRVFTAEVIMSSTRFNGISCIWSIYGAREEGVC